jgi:hypothetical protein
VAKSERQPTDARRRAVRAERAARLKVPLLARTGLDEWTEWFAGLEHPFARAWGEFFPGPEERSLGVPPNPDAAVTLTNLATSARDHFLEMQKQALEEAVAAVHRVDALSLLGLMLFFQRFRQWGSSQDPSAVPDDLDFELACQIVSGSAPSTVAGFDPADVTEAFGRLAHLRYLAHAVSTADRFVPAGESAGVTDEAIRNDLLSRRLIRRGAAYRIHAKQLSLQLGSAHGPAMVGKLGFDVADFVAVSEALAELWRDTVTPAVDEALKEAERVLAATSDPPPSVRTAAFLEAAQRWIVPAVVPTVGEIRDRLAAPTRDRLDDLLKAMSLCPGEAEPIRGVLDEPAARDRPFLVFGGPSPELPDDRRVLVAGPGALLTDMVATVEPLLARTFVANWSSARARAVDTFALDLLASRLPGATVLSSVFVDAPDGSGRFEMDGLLLFDDIALFVEGKGAPFKLASRRGSVDRYRGQLKDLIGYGATQLARDARLLDGGPVPLLDDRGATVGRLDPGKIRTSFQILPSLDDLGDIGTRMSLLDTMSLLAPDQTPWIVGVTDMAIVIDALRGPAELVAYLEWRSQWVREPRLLIVDEVELFVLYQRAVDLPARLREAGNNAKVIFASGQPAFDDYYSGLDRTGPPSPLPRVRLTKRFARFSEELSRLRPPGWLAAVSAAVQVPESLQTVFEDRATEKSLAARATRRGWHVSGDTDFATVVVAADVPWPEAFDNAGLPARYAGSALVLLFRVVGSRLRLEWACRGNDMNPPPRWTA